MTVLYKPSLALPNNPTNNTFVNGGYPTLSGASSTNLSSATVTFDASSDVYEFSITDTTTRKAIVCVTSYGDSVISAISDIANAFLTSDAGTGYYVSKSANSAVITIKNRTGGTVTVLVKTNDKITSATAWA